MLPSFMGLHFRKRETNVNVVIEVTEHLLNNNESKRSPYEVNTGNPL